MIKLPAPNYDLSKIVVEGSAVFAHGNAEMMEALIRVEEAVTKAGMDMNALNDNTFIPRNIGESRPDLIGRYLVAMIKMGELNVKMQNSVKLSLDEKKEVAKQYRSISEELKVVVSQIGKAK